MYGRRPLTRLESALYVIVVSAVVLVLFDRLLAHFAYAERAMVDVTLMRTQSALHTRLAFDLLRGQAPDLDAWSAHNPFDLAKMKPSNYAGELDASNPRLLEDGKWAYDPVLRELIYVPRHTRGLAVEGGGQVLRFRLLIKSAAAPPQFVTLTPYSWNP